jgi:hypothetical protein
MSSDEQGTTCRNTPVRAPGRQAALKGNLRNEVHGGAGATVAITKGKPFTGLAAAEEQRVLADLAECGRGDLVNELATRLHTATRLFWNAIAMVADAASQGDATALQRLDGYMARFGWLAASALRAWEQVRREEASQPDALDYEVMIKHGDPTDH